MRSLARGTRAGIGFDACLDLTFRQVPVTDDSLPSAVLKQLLVGGQMAFNFGLHGLRQQALSPGSKNLCQHVRDETAIWSVGITAVSGAFVLMAYPPSSKARNSGDVVVGIRHLHLSRLPLLGIIRPFAVEDTAVLSHRIQQIFRIQYSIRPVFIRSYPCGTPPMQ